MNNDIIYTAEEVDAIRRTYLLLQDGSFTKKFKGYFNGTPFTQDNISKRHLAVTVIVSKCRPEEAAEKYIKWVGVLQEWGIMALSDNELLHAPDGSDDYLRNYAVCGRDVDGRRIFWINGGAKPIPNDKEEEKKSHYAALRYYMALHSDSVTLRDGCTFVIDLTHKSNTKEGNESRMQRAHNAYPLRPQNIYIIGASAAVRISVNALLKIAAFTTRMKILSRIKFVTLDEAMVENGGVIPRESLPIYHASSPVEDLSDCINNLQIEEEKKTDEHSSSDSGPTSLTEWVNRYVRALPLPDI